MELPGLHSPSAHWLRACGPFRPQASGSSSTSWPRAFYAFPRITSTGLDAETFSRRLLDEEYVAVVPGNAFGPSGAEHVRACYATSYERLEEALARIGRFVERCH